MSEETGRRRFTDGTRITVWGQPATVVRLWRDEPTIIVFRLDDGRESTIITHFHDGINPHVQELTHEAL